MTNEEAIQAIKSISQWEYWQNDTLEAFILAIQALERPQVTVFCENADEKTIDELKNELEQVNNELRPHGEWVRREDVIHLLEHWADGYSYIEIPTDDAIKAIKELEGDAE